jgi:hypothetical protein
LLGGALYLGDPMKFKKFRSNALIAAVKKRRRLYSIS